MLKHLGYDGGYRDDALSVSAFLEHPSKHGLEPSVMAFSVVIRAMEPGVSAPPLQDFTFYIMDERRRMYNAEIRPYMPVTVDEDEDEDDEPTLRPNALITTAFQPEFLFQDLRVAFYNPTNSRLGIIPLQVR